MSQIKRLAEIISNKTVKNSSASAVTPNPSLTDILTNYINNGKDSQLFANQEYAQKLLKSFSKFETAPDSYNTIGPIRIYMMGAPGSGKGTYGKLLARDLNIPYIETGSIIRNILKDPQDSELKSNIQSLVNQGKFISDELAYTLVLKQLEETTKEFIDKNGYSGGYILDGYPRNILQFEMMQRIHPCMMAVNLYLPDKILLEKLLGRKECSHCKKGYNLADIRSGEYCMPPLLPSTTNNPCPSCSSSSPSWVVRSDDNEEVISSRLKEFNNQTSPLISHLEELGIMKKFIPKKGLEDYELLRNYVVRSMIELQLFKDWGEVDNKVWAMLDEELPVMRDAYAKWKKSKGENNRL